VALAPVRASGSEPDSGKHYIWRVTNAPAPFYLVGSVHSLSGKDYPLAKPVMDAFHEVKCVVFEFNPNADEEFSEKFEKASKLPKGQKIYNRLHPQTLEFLKKRFWISSLNIADVENWKAWRIASIRGYPELE
jgi:uncharacterized protein YbaP (TraB family)